jgi:predicted nucleic acid-binding protein
MINAVYFDTSVLRSIRFTLDDERISKFLDICRKSQVSLWVPDIVVTELASYYYREIQELKVSIEKACRRLNIYQPLTSTSIGKVETPTADFNNIKEKLIKYCEESGITCIPNAECDIGKLSTDAALRRTPFDESGRGFRDAVILETVFVHARSQRKKPILILSKDGDFKEVDLQSRGKKSGIEVHRVATLEDAGQLINKRYMDDFWSWIKERQDKVVVLAEKDREAIFNYVRDNFKPTESFLHGRPREDKLGLTHIESIDDYTFLHLKRGSPYPELFEPPQEGRKLFEIAVETEFVLTVRGLNVFESSHFQLPSEQIPGVRLPRGALGLGRTNKTVRLNRDIPVIVSVKDVDDQFQDLQILSCAPFT